MTEEEKYTNPNWRCKKCSGRDVWYTEDETWDCYPRYNYHCHICNYRWSAVDESD